MSVKKILLLVTALMVLIQTPLYALTIQFTNYNGDFKQYHLDTTNPKATVNIGGDEIVANCGGGNTIIVVFRDMPQEENKPYTINLTGDRWSFNPNRVTLQKTKKYNMSSASTGWCGNINVALAS